MSDAKRPGAGHGPQPAPDPAVERQRRHRRVSAAGLQAEIAQSRKPPPMPQVALVNLSESGAAILATMPLGDADEAFQLRVRPGPGGEPVSYICQIRYLIGETRPDSAGPRWLHGVRFRRVAPPARDFARHWVVAHG